MIFRSVTICPIPLLIVYHACQYPLLVFSLTTTNWFFTACAIASNKLPLKSQASQLQAYRTSSNGLSASGSNQSRGSLRLQVCIHPLLKFPLTSYGTTTRLPMQDRALWSRNARVYRDPSTVTSVVGPCTIRTSSVVLARFYAV